MTSIRIVGASLFACLGAFASPALGQSENRIYNLLFGERQRLEAVEKDPATSPERAAEAKLKRERLAALMYEPDKSRVQVLLSEIVEEPGQPPTLKRSDWRAGQEYFYPASAIKLCGAVAALERLNELRRTKEPELTEHTPLAFNPLVKGKPLIEKDPDNLEGSAITLAHLIREAALVSDNEAFNRLYDFSTPQWLNERMWRAGLPSTRLRHRLSDDTPKEKQKISPTIELRYPNHTGALGPTFYELADNNEWTGHFVGRWHMDGKEKVRGGMSFFFKNVMTLADLQKCLVRVARPDIALEDGEPFDLTDAQRAFLLEALSQYPGDSKNPVYPRDKFPDDYCKFFLPGLARVVPKEHLRVYGKSGFAYGFVTDNAYIVDTRSKRAFFLSATVWADSDNCLNDDKYDYESMSMPFLADVAEIIGREVWNVPFSK